MARVSSIDPFAQIETTCGTLLNELQIIWDEVGEADEDRDRMLYELEQECLDVYRKKVDQANRCRAKFRQAIAEAEAELAAICSSMSEPPIHIRQTSQNVASLKEELKALNQQLEDMRKKKGERLNQFLEVTEQIRKISAELGANEHITSKLVMDESDLTIRKLEDLCKQLELLQKEKSERLKQVMDYLSILNSLCSVLGDDFKETIKVVHPSLDDNERSKSISTDTIAKLASTIHRLRETKIQRMQKLQDLATALLELWNLMDTPFEEQQRFQNVTRKIAASEDEITEPNSLSLDFIDYVETEVSRLEQLKVSKMKELVLKKKTELEELRRRTHLVSEANNEVEFALDAIEAGAINASLVLGQIDSQISIVKEEAFSRKDILERVEKWMHACEEEAWLEEYNRDENRFNAGRGAHLTFKRAEKARALVNKIPAIVDTLVAKVTQWEREMGFEFTYDGVPLLSMLEEYNLVRLEKEQEQKRQRDQKKLQSQLIAEQEALYGSKPSPSKCQSAKKVPRTSIGGQNRRLSVGGAAIQTPKPDLLYPAKSTRSTKKIDDVGPHSPGYNDISGYPIKKLSYNSVTSAHDADLARKPFAPLVPVNNIQSIPSKPNNGSLEEDTCNHKPVPVFHAKTPMTEATMQLATTPAPTRLIYDTADYVAPVNSVAGCATPVHVTQDEIEYSFEEKRYFFYLRQVK